MPRGLLLLASITSQWSLWDFVAVRFIYFFFLNQDKVVQPYLLPIVFFLKT
jgi:hypothetical protein